MGWLWGDGDGEGSAGSWPSRHRGGGSGGSAGGEEGEEGCAMRKVVKTKCSTEEVEPGKFVRKCEKTEQLLRQLAGRQAEVVESNTEYTEDDVTDGRVVESLLGLEGPIAFPGLRSDIEALESNMLGGFSRFMDAAEEMRNGFFQAFGVPSIFEHEPSFDLRRAPYGFFQKEDASSKPPNESPYAEFAGKVTDV